MEVFMMRNFGKQFLLILIVGGALSPSAYGMDDAGKRLVERVTNTSGAFFSTIIELHMHKIKQQNLTREQFREYINTRNENGETTLEVLQKVKSTGNNDCAKAEKILIQTALAYGLVPDHGYKYFILADEAHDLETIRKVVIPADEANDLETIRKVEPKHRKAKINTVEQFKNSFSLSKGLGLDNVFRVDTADIRSFLTQAIKERFIRPDFWGQMRNFIYAIGEKR